MYLLAEIPGADGPRMPERPAEPRPGEGVIFSPSVVMSNFGVPPFHASRWDAGLGLDHRYTGAKAPAYQHRALRARKLRPGGPFAFSRGPVAPGCRYAPRNLVPEGRMN